MKNIVVYSKHHCQYCVKMKKYLDENNIKYILVNLDNVDNRQKFIDDVVSKYPSIKTVPQMFVDDEWIGGYDELMAKVSEGYSLESE